MNKKILAAIAVAITGIITIISTPSDTTIPIPQPDSIDNSNDKNITNNNSGIITIASGLKAATALDISKDDRIFFTEKEGKIFEIKNEKLLNKPLAHIHVESSNDAGLLGITLHPNFTENHLIYIYHSFKNNSKIFNRVVLLTEKDDQIVNSKTLIDNIPGSSYNNGGVLKFGTDGKLYIGTGDTLNPKLAADLESLAGKILRINPDGTIPRDNPFPNSIVYSIGHRNVMGFSWNPDTKQLYESERGPSGFDEINKIDPGKNYGWPEEKCMDKGKFEPSFLCFNPAIEPAGILFPKSNKLGYENDLLITSLRGSHLRQIDSDNNNLQNNILVGYGRLKDIVESSDGYLYILTSNTDGYGFPQKDDDKILKILKP